jgi:hypothetical protein
MELFTRFVFSTLAVVTLATADYGSSYNITYSTVTGYFLQDKNSTNATTFDYVSPPNPFNPPHRIR